MIKAVSFSEVLYIIQVMYIIQENILMRDSMNLKNHILMVG
jgi:hypothetical protein